MEEGNLSCYREQFCVLANVGFYNLITWKCWVELLIRSGQRITICNVRVLCLIFCMSVLKLAYRCLYKKMRFSELNLRVLLFTLCFWKYGNSFKSIVAAVRCRSLCGFWVELFAGDWIRITLRWFAQKIVSPKCCQVNISRVVANTPCSRCQIKDELSNWTIP